MIQRSHAMLHRTLLALVLFGAATALMACNARLGTDLAAAQQTEPIGNTEQGRIAIQRYGCGSCHTIRGISGANGLVGPPLTGIGARAYIAGVLPNTPDNMMNWIRNPQSYVPGNAMPNLGVTEQDARDITGYLQTLTDQPR